MAASPRLFSAALFFFPEPVAVAELAALVAAASSRPDVALALAVPVAELLIVPVVR